MVYEGVKLIFLHELQEHLAKGDTLEQVIEELKRDGVNHQVLEWSSPIGNNYKFFAQQLAPDGQPRERLGTILHVKEFTYNGNQH